METPRKEFIISTSELINIFEKHHYHIIKHRDTMNSQLNNLRKQYNDISLEIKNYPHHSPYKENKEEDTLKKYFDHLEHINNIVDISHDFIEDLKEYDKNNQKFFQISFFDIENIIIESITPNISNE